MRNSNRNPLARRACSLVVWMAWASSLVGCHAFQVTPVHPLDDPGYQPAGVAQDGLPEDVPPALVLLAGDSITVKTISSESFEYPDLIVDDQGKVHVPLAGAVVVKGLSPQEAERKLEEVLQRFDRFVRVSVLVSSWAGHYATVLGSVTQEGTVPLSPGMRLAEVIARAGGPQRTTNAAGGITDVSDLDAARVIRNGAPLPVNLRLALTGDPRHNVLVHPGDTIHVPAGLGSRIAILGNIGAGGVMLQYRQGVRLSEALATGGGITLDADDNDIRVIRGPLENPIVYVSSLEALVDGDGTDIELAPGDIVFVSEHWIASVGEVINRVAPLLNIATTAINTYLIVKTLSTQ